MSEVAVYNEKEYLIQNMEREFRTTIKLLKSFPPGKQDLKPAEKLRTARELAWTFVVEQIVTEKIISGNLDFKGKPTDIPETLEEIITIYENKFQENIKRLRNLSDASFNSTIRWYIGPGELGDSRKADILQMFFLDMIHHRGQFSVYVRIAGGRVPSIYGSTAEEDWSKKPS